MNENPGMYGIYKEQKKWLNKMVKLRYFECRSDAIRQALKYFLVEHLEKNPINTPKQPNQIKTIQVNCDDTITIDGIIYKIIQKEGRNQ